jgi:hypothetical protein
MTNGRRVHPAQSCVVCAGTRDVSPAGEKFSSAAEDEELPLWAGRKAREPAAAARRVENGRKSE